MSHQHVVLVDFADGSTQAERSQQIYRALQGTGFVRLCHAPGYDFGLVRELHDAAREFFDLPDKVRQALYVPEHGGEVGYMPRRVETAVGGEAPDEKSYFTVGREGGSSIANFWPPKACIPGFRELVIQGFGMLDRVMYTLTERLGPTIGLPNLIRALDGGNSRYRLIDYHALDGSQSAKAVRSKEHRDASLLTLLPRATGAGLQIFVGGEWIDADTLAAPDELIVNAGDTLAMVAFDQGHALPSTLHRVVNGDGRRRISGPFFGHLHPQYVLDQKTGLTVEAFLADRLTELKLLTAATPPSQEGAPN